ncbi:MAG: transcriptional regulator, luxr family protein [Ilumatobacteraceae bacterium]|nr:transcriptional regulator, luxr family protein [Ilumatobacteraceae bacterium]
MQNRLTGRDAERRACIEALDRAPLVTSRLELIGEPGIGKSTLFDLTVAAAGTRGFRVLLARPNRAEAALAYSGLGDLLAGITAPPMLTPPERRAFDIALGRTLAEGAQISARTLGAAVAATLRALAGEGPTLIAIDDMQWLDAASADVLSFVLRRLPERNTMLLIARRPDGNPVLAADEQVHVAPLTTSASRHLAAEVATVPISGAALDRIVTASRGNPLFVIELVRNFAGQAGPILPLPVPASLRQIVADRLRELPDASIEALALSALLAAPTVEALTALGALDDLLPAERAGIVELVGREIVFSHPLLASAAHDAIPGTQRLRLHRRLAEVTTGLQRCIHLAFGTDHRDAMVATELAAAMVDLTDRGAINEAADLAVLALSITPDDDPDRYERLIRGGEVLFRAGRTREALEHLEVARNGAPSANLVARALLALAIIEYSHTDNAENAASLATSALGMTDDPAVLIEAHTVLSRVLYTDFGAAADHAATALRLMEETGTRDDLALAAALNASAAANFMAGRGLDRPMFERAIALEAGSSVSAADSAAGALAALLKYADELDEARAMLESLVDDADEGSLPYVLGHLPQLDVWMGRWDDAERSARRQLDLARAAEQDSQVQTANFNLAFVGAFRGEIDEARPLAQALYDEGRSTGSLWTERMGAGLLGFLAMSVGKAAEAVEYLGRYSDIAALMGLNDPGYFRFQADFFEALVAVGDIDRAVIEIERMEPFVNRMQRPSALAALHRGRALVAAHRGEIDTAVAEARAAVAVLDGTALVYDRARAMLTLGVVLRRFKLRAEARAALSPALELFEQMGARSLVERVRIELGRLGVRAVTSLDLTETEARVAQLAAEGRTTRQIADTMFISIKTVEANMTRIYRKLGVGNRAELANLLASTDTP